MKIIDYIIEKSKYDCIIYSDNGDDLSDNDLETIKNLNYKYNHSMEMTTDSDEENYIVYFIVYFIELNSRLIEIYVDIDIISDFRNKRIDDIFNK